MWESIIRIRDIWKNLEWQDQTELDYVGDREGKADGGERGTCCSSQENKGTKEEGH